MKFSNVGKAIRREELTAGDLFAFSVGAKRHLAFAVKAAAEDKVHAVSLTFGPQGTARQDIKPTFMPRSVLQIATLMVIADPLIQPEYSGWQRDGAIEVFLENSLMALNAGSLIIQGNTAFLAFQDGTMPRHIDLATGLLEPFNSEIPHVVFSNWSISVPNFENNDRRKIFSFPLQA